MDNIETPYDEETQFIDCTVCEKSIRGGTLYKIHLTTPGHIKREDFLVSQGLAVRQHIVPIFNDICEYLDYLNLDEPIIGLGCLEEIPNLDPETGPKYMCKLCNHISALANMVCHVIGRKHRLKYIEEKRSDLVTWDGLTVRSQGGKVMKAKAEIIERQDGRGAPKAMLRRGPEGMLNISRVSQRRMQKTEENIPQRRFQDGPARLPEFKGYNRWNAAAGYSNMPTEYPDEPHMNRNRDTLSHDRADKEGQRADYRGGLNHREDYTKPEYRSSYEGKYGEEPQRSGVRDLCDVLRYDYREQMPHCQSQETKYYAEQAAPNKRPFPERDALQEFYAEEVRRGQLRSQEYKPSQMVYPEGEKQRWSLERESDTNRSHKQGSSEPEGKKRNMFAPLESDRSLFDMGKNYHHERSKSFEVETFDNPGPSRAASSVPGRHVEVSNTISNIPEPFQRFLKGGPNNEGRKRRSRFSDASPEELEMTKKIFRDGYGASYPETGEDSRRTGAPLRPEIHVTQYPHLYGESQSQHQSEDSHGGGSESPGAFDMLKNIEIENVEEAEFLKSKICDLLKEFKTKKLEKAALNSQSQPGISKNYDDLKLNPQQPRPYRYERSQREDSDHRRPEARDYRSGPSWKQNEVRPEEQYMEYNHPTQREPRQSNRSHYEDEPASYPERFEEPMGPRDYKPAVEEFYEPLSSAPTLQMEHLSRMQRDSRYSNNLDKITSALLELVKRK